MPTHTVAQGIPFRDAYRRVGAELRTSGLTPALERADFVAAAMAKDYPGAPGNLSLDDSYRAVEALRSAVDADRAPVVRGLTQLAGQSGARLTWWPPEGGSRSG